MVFNYYFQSRDPTSDYSSLSDITGPPKVLVSITFTKRDDDDATTRTFGPLYDVRHNFADGTSLLSVHVGDNFENYRPSSNLVAIMQDGQPLADIPSSFLNWLTFSE